jgi:hypothetical protein
MGVFSQPKPKTPTNQIFEKEKKTIENFRTVLEFTIVTRDSRAAFRYRPLEITEQRIENGSNKIDQFDRI